MRSIGRLLSRSMTERIRHRLRCETLGAERQMVIVAHDMSWLTMCRIGMVMFEGWSG